MICQKRGTNIYKLYNYHLFVTSKSTRPSFQCVLYSTLGIALHRPPEISKGLDWAWRFPYCQQK